MQLITLTESVWIAQELVWDAGEQVMARKVGSYWLAEREGRKSVLIPMSAVADLVSV